jgi:hypothetical protein
MRVTPGQQCPDCGAIAEDPPLCYGAEAPWRMLGISDAEFDKRVDLTADQCVVDEKHFFIRGHVILPIVGSEETFAWSVWCSLSEQSFLHACERWFIPERASDPPYFGWLMTSLPCYPETLQLKTSVQSREVAVVPTVTIEPSAYPLSVEQRVGVTMDRVREFAHEILHAGSGGA